MCPKGYLREVRKRPDMFTEENVSAIFGNVESLYVFQSDFLQQLELCIDWQQPHKSAIGQAFIRNVRKPSTSQPVLKSSSKTCL